MQPECKTQNDNLAACLGLRVHIMHVSEPAEGKMVQEKNYLSCKAG